MAPIGPWHAIDGMKNGEIYEKTHSKPFFTGRTHLPKASITLNRTLQGSFGLQVAGVETEEKLALGQRGTIICGIVPNTAAAKHDIQ